ncbi:MAG: hypothetical protein ACKVZH_28950 [Blastocatellia bacterium]
MKRNFPSLVLPAFAILLMLAITAMAQQQRQPGRGPGTATIPASPAGTYRITVPFERDDLGSDFHIPNGSVVASISSAGVFTTRDHAMMAIIPYQGMESSLKFSVGQGHDWTLPNGIIWVDILKMHVRPDLGIREFHTNEATIHTFATSGAKIALPILPVGEYMIRARTKYGKFVFQPFTVCQCD